MTKTLFRTNTNSGFSIILKNGWTVSVQWGIGTHSDNHLSEGKYGDRQTSNTAEVAAYKDIGTPQGSWYEDNPRGYQTPEQVIEFIAKVAAL